MTFGSLFSGIGGIDLGLERAGMECLWQVEIDPFCQRVLAKHWPDVPKHGDIKKLTGEELGHVDLIAGGFPCQPVSLAGKRLAQDDPRWLWPDFARILRVVRPRYALLENVPGLLSRGMGDVLGDLAALGYDAEWQIISAAAAGAPQIRERVWIVSYAPSEHGEAWSGVASRTQRQPPFKPGGFPGSPMADGRQLTDTWSACESGLDRMANGVPSRVDRLRALGNAVVPQVVEWIGQQILEADGRL